MRTNNHLQIKDNCTKSIPSLMEKFGLGLVTSIETDQLGWVNPVFFVNQKFVFRFNARDVNLPKLQREKIAYDLLAKTDVPVPKVICFDESKAISQYDVMVTNKIDGLNVEAQWSNLNLEERSVIAEKSGKILRKIHSITMNTFGDLSLKSPLPQTKNWFDYLSAKIHFHLNEAKEFSLFNSEQMEMTWKMLNGIKDDLNAVSRPSLLHVDYHFGNVLSRKSEIVGVLDFEWSMAGDPLYDLCSHNSMNETWPDSQAGFLRGYGVEKFSKIEDTKMKIYQMIKNIELCVVAKKHFTVEESANYLKTTVIQINTLRKTIGGA